MISLERVDRIWRSTRRIFYLVLIGWAFVFGINVRDAYQTEHTVPWELAFTMLLILVWAFVVLGFCWLIYRFIRRSAEFHERRK